jgi:hypothetical protein
MFKHRKWISYMPKQHLLGLFCGRAKNNNIQLDSDNELLEAGI